MEYTREMLGRTRLRIVEVVRWLDTLPDFEHYDDDRMLFVVGAIAKEAWIKYGLTNTEDLQQYALLHFRSKTGFDADPVIQEMFQKNKASPGAFAAVAQNIPDDVLKKISRRGGVSQHPLIRLEYYE